MKTGTTPGLLVFVESCVIFFATPLNYLSYGAPILPHPSLPFSLSLPLSPSPLKRARCLQNYVPPVPPKERQVGSRFRCRHRKFLMRERIPFICMQRPLIAGGSASTGTEESRRALHPLRRRLVIIMHRDLLDLDSQGGNWFYNLKQREIERKRENTHYRHRRNRNRRNSVARARFHMRDRTFTNHFP